MNTFKTLTLYNRHAVDCKHVKNEQPGQKLQQQQQQVTRQGGVVVRRNIVNGGGNTGHGGGGNTQHHGRLNAKIEFRTLGGGPKDDDIVILDNDDSKARPAVKQEIKPMQTVVETRRPSYSVVNHGVGAISSVNGPKLYRCIDCDAAFDTKANLEVHANEVHTDTFCEECEDDFMWPDENHDCYYTRYKLRYISGDIVPAF